MHFNRGRLFFSRESYRETEVSPRFKVLAMPSKIYSPSSSRRDFVKNSLIASAGFAGAAVTRVQASSERSVSRGGDSPEDEWDAERAIQFWPEMRSHWAPVSWKDHPHNFNVLYNGTVMAVPSVSGINPFVNPEDQVFGAELRVRTSISPMGTGAADISLFRGVRPDGQQVPSWGSGVAPEYIMEHTMRKSVVYVEQRQFAHVPGAQRIVRGNEPHFLWMRFVVSDVIEFINLADHVYVYLTFLKPNTHTEIAAFNNINPNFGFGIPSYPFPFHFESTEDWSKPAYLRLGQQGRLQARPATAYRRGLRNRLAFPAGQKTVSVKYLESRMFLGAVQPLSHLELKIPAKLGAKIDLVLPMVPVDDETMNRELELGYDGARAETEAFWKKELSTSTRIQMSEPLVQGYFTQFPRLQAMLGQKEPSTGEYGIRTSSLHYEIVWSTPTAMSIHALDLVGMPAEAEKYLETYLGNQGKIKPPSPYLDRHPGYFGPPENMSFINWITDHAAILWAASAHGLITMDANFLRRWEEPIVKGCEFIQLALRAKGHGGYEGIMPPGVPNDTSAVSAQVVWNDAWYHKAFLTAVRLLERTRHPRAAEFRQSVNVYHDTFQKAFRDVVSQSKRWEAPDGTKVPFIPMALTRAKTPGLMQNDAPLDGEEGNSTEDVNLSAAHAFFLDTGSLSLVFGELFPADDPIMKAALRWFREGPQFKKYREFSSPYQAPLLHAEVSSCEPIYSFNLFHTLELGERRLFSMGLYGQFAGGHCRGSFVGCETREGLFGVMNTLPLLATRQALIQESGDELHLLRMAPLAFFRGEGFGWEQATTEFGPLSISGRWDETQRSLTLDYKAPVRRRPARTFLHLPPFSDVAVVTLNGRVLSEKRGMVAL